MAIIIIINQRNLSNFRIQHAMDSINNNNNNNNNSLENDFNNNNNNNSNTNPNDLSPQNNNEGANRRCQ